MRVAIPLLLNVVVAVGTVPSRTDAQENTKAVDAKHAADMQAGLTLFRREVRTILTGRCLLCHGGESIEGEFDIRTRETFLKTGSDGPNVAVGKAKQSRLYKLITHADEPNMPEDGAKLSDTAIAAIAQWIDLGAPYDKPLVVKSNDPLAWTRREIDPESRKFWSFQPLNPIDPPTVQSDWPVTPVDRYILAAQNDRELHPNPRASKRLLIRRASFDLIGLPPTPEQVARFLADESPNAYARLIDRLLESPHYGERWARHWMDIARFAESHGYEQDYDRKHAYHYRDFLIKAFNQDLPYDRFVRWQIAGDELAPEDPLAMTATGFLGAGAFPTQLTETEFESARYDELDDMVNTTGAAFLGLTLGCARCHDHKFDPIPSADYYRMVSTFTTAIRSEIDLNLSPQLSADELAARELKRDAAARTLQEYEDGTLPGKFREWLKTYDTANPPASWSLLEIVKHESTGGTKFATQPDGSLLATGEAPAREVITLVGKTTLTNITSLRLEALTHPSFPHRGPGRASNGNFALGNIEVTAAPAGDSSAAKPIKLVAARATHQQNTGDLSVAASIDGDPVSGWAVDAGGIGKDQAAVFGAGAPFGFADGTEITVTLTLNHPNTKHTIGRPRLSVSNRAAPVPITEKEGIDPKVADALLAAKRNGRSANPTALQWFARRDPQWQRLSQAVADLGKRPDGPKAKVQVTSEGFPHMKHHADGRGFPHFYPETHFLNRGDVHQKQGVATQRFLQVLSTDDGLSPWQQSPPAGWTRTSFRRAALANWLTDAKRGAGHLAARVIVNRVWQHHFGQGIVATPNDFGYQGKRPTHPELLDWLAADLIENGWRLKRLHKLIMTSAVYMQDSSRDGQREKIDRENRYYWRRSPRRLEGEVIRDTMLSVAGMLDATQFGPGTLDPNMRRRSVYFFIKRSKLIPMMMLFDWPEHLVSIGRRSRTTIAPQALMFINNPQARQYAAAFARRLPDDQDAAIDLAYRMALGRQPADAERKLGSAFLEQQEQAHRKAGRSNAAELARTDLCQTIFSTNEFVYVD